MTDKQIMPMAELLPSDPDEAERYVLRQIEEIRDEYQLRIQPWSVLLFRMRKTRSVFAIQLTPEQLAAIVGREKTGAPS